jgi:starvation-inducible DNA-binding protein
MASKNGTKTANYPDLGLSEKAYKGVVNILRTLLADEHVFYIKLRNFHWNVKGAQFRALHEILEEQYTAAADTIDEIAERIVQYGATAPGTMAEFLDYARLSESSGDVPSAHDIVAKSVADHEALIRYMRKDIKAIGDDYEDVGAEDLLTGLLQQHQKQAWMLRAMLEGDHI